MTDEHDFVRRAKARLDERSDDVDPVVAARLRAARLRALDTLEAPRLAGARVWAPALAVAGVALFIVVGWLSREPADLVLADDVEDVELLASEDDFDLYEDLEFYTWLDEQTVAG